MADELKHRVRIAQLAMLYGKLLTHRQQKVLTLYHDHDLSLAEVAEQTGISRQAVRDALIRAEESLQNYERKLGFHKCKTSIQQHVAKLNELISEHKPLLEIERELKRLHQSIDANWSDNDV